MRYNNKVWNLCGTFPWQERFPKADPDAMGNRKYDKGVCFMANYLAMNREELAAEKAALEAEYKSFRPRASS